jgi:Regulator of ribonuclease activity B
MARCCVVLGVLFMWACAQDSRDLGAAQEGNSETAELQEMFDFISTQSGLDLSKPHVWGYFFTDSSRELLERAARLLEGEGYTVVSIEFVEKKSAYDRDMWQLHVEKVEVHTVISLYLRDQVLHHFADENGLYSYSGWAIGNVRGSQ